MTVNPVAVIRYQLDNHLGSASLELDETADIISYEEYHPFGTTSYRSGRTETETSLKRYKYVGKERDEETGLYYYGARYYAAWLCRFVSVDPLNDKYPDLSSYQYASNRPIVAIDLDGLEAYLPKEIAGLCSSIETKANEIADEIGIFAEKSWEVTKGVGKGVWNLLVYSTMAGQAENTVRDKRDIKPPKDLWEATIGVNPINIYKGIKDTYKYGTLEDKAQITTELVGTGVTLFEGLRGNLAITPKATLKRTFKEGSVHITTTKRLEKFPDSPTYGGKDLFVGSKTQIDDLLSIKGIKRADIEKALGLDPGALEGGELLRIDISPEAMKNLRYPRGVEGTVNEQFILGGKTSGGISEGIIDAVGKKTKGVKRSEIKLNNYE
ncbi:hypothetical protein L3073_00080 [Ancylomarina sp. DW003]|nr:RHS repeat-associated core domain-containing protein [Ancylomarina sp. DW003]MDE5420599.1 hypothetical protein [Ancylomarina sp. DW003]